MWAVSGVNLQMVEGDYGIELPVTIGGEITLGNQDSLKFTFKTSKNGGVILEKNYDGITDNTVNLEFTIQDTRKFAVGNYVYSLDWYQSGSFMCNLVPDGAFKVVDKV